MATGSGMLLKTHQIQCCVVENIAQSLLDADPASALQGFGKRVMSQMIAAKSPALGKSFTPEVSAVCACIGRIRLYQHSVYM
jgi:hypothetical protein